MKKMVLVLRVLRIKPTIFMITPKKVIINGANLCYANWICFW